jgi:hypothetical protein
MHVQVHHSYSSKYKGEYEELLSIPHFNCNLLKLVFASFYSHCRR